MSEKREMSAVEFLKEMKRMCKSYPVCAGCEIERVRIETKSHSCFTMLREHPEQTVASVQKWAEEHPRKTMVQDFFEKFPKAPKDVDGLPTFCPNLLGYGEKDCCQYIKEGKAEDCMECWNRPLEVEE